MAPHKPPLPEAAKPKYGRNFDPWNNVSGGHQRAETKGPQGWRECRTMKLQSQLTAGNSGGLRLADTVGAGSEDFDEVHKVLVPKEVCARSERSVMDMLLRPGSMSMSTSQVQSRNSVASNTADTMMSTEEKLMAQRKDEDESDKAAKAEALSNSGSSSSIFEGLVVYVNGSTYPLISDHKLKHVLAENGARISSHLGRRHVTHVILGRPSGPNGGAGGGLAGGKLEKEIRRISGCSVSYVGVEWVLESLKAGRRLPEARFSNLKLTSKGQPSVFDAFSKAKR